MIPVAAAQDLNLRWFLMLSFLKQLYPSRRHLARHDEEARSLGKCADKRATLRGECSDLPRAQAGCLQTAHPSTWENVRAGLSKWGD